MIWALGAALLIVTVGGLLWPVLRGRKDTLKRTESALAIFEDQLAEVDRDADRGLISGQEAESARIEIKRRMIAAAKVKDSQTQSGGTWLVLLSVLLVPFGTFGVYMATGSPQVPSLPFAEREVERSQTAELQQLAQDLRDRLLSAPDGGPSEGWVLLGQTYMRLGLYTDAAVAFQTSVARGGETSGAYSQLAEALIAAEDGAVSAEAQAAIGRSLQLDPLNPAATYYQAISLQQQGNTGGARDLLIARLERESRAAQWMPSFVNLINRMGDEIGVEPVSLDAFVEPPRGPSAADVEAAQAMSPEEQVVFIESMVDGLAARLEEDPTDLNGWIQLGRSYMVLEREDDARDAFGRAAPLITDLPANDPRRAIVERMLSE